jgi:hypothetical protein
MDVGGARETRATAIATITLTLIIQFNSIRVYLRANLTAQRPITKLG